MTTDDIIKKLRDMARYPTVTLPRDCEALNKAADLLAEQAKVQPSSIPEGWKLVPIKPTQAMLDEMNLTGREGYDEVMGDGFSASLYHAALIASPAQPKAEQEPVAWVDSDWHYQLNKKGMVVAHLDKSDVLIGNPQPLYTHPQPKREWVGLTDEEITNLHHEIKVQLMGSYKTVDLYRAIEAKLKEKNT